MEKSSISLHWIRPSTYFDIVLVLISFHSGTFIPRNTYPHQGWDLWLDFCIPLQNSPCSGGTECASCLQWDATQGEGGKACMGTYTTLEYSEDTQGVVATIGGGKENRTGVFHLTCKQDTVWFLPVLCYLIMQESKAEFTAEDPTRLPLHVVHQICLCQWLSSSEFLLWMHTDAQLWMVPWYSDMSACLYSCRRLQNLHWRLIPVVQKTELCWLFVWS